MSAHHQSAIPLTNTTEFVHLRGQAGRVKETDKGKKNMTFMQSVQNFAAAVLPLFFSKPDTRDHSTKIRDEVHQYIAHAEMEMKKARAAYCDELIDIARHRTEAQSQLVRIREMQTVVEMMKTADVKSLEVMQQELNQYAGTNN